MDMNKPTQPMPRGGAIQRGGAMPPEDPEEAAMAEGFGEGEEPEGQEPENKGTFTAPDWRPFTPPELVDTVERVMAAGMKLMYSEGMRDELRQAVQSDAPMPQKLAENAAGLLLMLDNKSQGGIPLQAMFPAGMALLGEAVEVVQAAGQEVGQEDFNDAALLMFAILGKKMGASDEDLMSVAQQAAAGGAGAPQGQPMQAPAQGEQTAPVDEETAAMIQGMQS